MDKKYEIDIFDLTQFKILEKDLNKLSKELDSEEFMNFISKKSMNELEKVIKNKLSTEDYSSNYRSSNHSEVKKEQVRIYNDSMVNLDHLSPKTLANYPNGLSLALLAEFGTGIPRY